MGFMCTRDVPPDGENVWPTKVLAHAIRSHGPTAVDDITIKMGFVDCTDVTKESQEDSRGSPFGPQIVTFAPDVYLSGLGLLRERTNEKQWGGVLVRALQSNDGNQRCLQYLYVYMNQNGVVSAFWNVFLPIVLGLWACFVNNHLIPVLDSSTPLARYPLLLLGVPFIPLLWFLIPHYNEFLEGRRFSFRSTTLLPIFFCLAVGSSFIPEIGFVIILIGIAFSMYWIADYLRWTGTSHTMDYVPVFIFLKRIESKWLFDFAVWDIWHYNTGSTKNPFTFHRHEAFEPFISVPLVIDNPWHSMYYGSPSFIGTRYTVAFSLLSIIFLGLVTNSISNILLYSQTSLLLPLLAFFSVLFGLLVARRPFPLLTPEERRSKLTSPEARLDEVNKIAMLWNLTEAKSKNFLSESRLRIVRNRLNARRKKIANELFKYKKGKLKIQGVRHKIWKLYKTKDGKKKDTMPEEFVTAFQENYELFYTNIGDELQILNDYIEKLEGYERLETDLRLVIISKMQNPFNTQPAFLDSFRDSMDDLYSYIQYNGPIIEIPNRERDHMDEDVSNG